MNLMIVPGILVCSSFLISVCRFIVSKDLLISSVYFNVYLKSNIQTSSMCYSDCSRRGGHLVEPLCYGVVALDITQLFFQYSAYAGRKASGI